MTGIGISGKIAKAFIQSKLTPLLVVAALFLGIFAVGITPVKKNRRSLFLWWMFL